MHNYTISLPFFISNLDDVRVVSFFFLLFILNRANRVPKIWKIFDDLENDSIEKKLSREETIVMTYRSIDFPLKRIRNAKNIYIYTHIHTCMYVYTRK